MNQSFQFEPLHKVSVFIGAYGSGKSEVSANFAAWLAETGRPVTLCDLDMINPYYRTADAAATLEKIGVNMVVPVFAGTNADVPALPGAVLSVFDQSDHYGVLDIGGEDLGARAVASLRPRLQVSDYAIYMVVNVMRPYTDTVAQIQRQAETLCATTGLPLTGLVQNTNLLAYSDQALIAETDQVVQQAAERMHVPVTFASGFSGKIPVSWQQRGWPVLKLKHFVRYPDHQDG